jgi:hypothetical protein
MTRQDAERTPLLVVQLRHCIPVRLSRGGCSIQFGRASVPRRHRASGRTRRVNRIFLSSHESRQSRFFE